MHCSREKCHPYIVGAQVILSHMGHLTYALYMTTYSMKLNAIVAEVMVEIFTQLFIAFHEVPS